VARLRSTILRLFFVNVLQVELTKPFRSESKIAQCARCIVNRPKSPDPIAGDTVGRFSQGTQAIPRASFATLGAKSALPPRSGNWFARHVASSLSSRQQSGCFRLRALPAKQGPNCPRAVCPQAVWPYHRTRGMIPPQSSHPRREGALHEPPLHDWRRRRISDR
jgi:hypothetical protein